ncbi:MAG: trypsin-like serine peptidase, partial [Roseicyclus sp.]
PVSTASGRLCIVPAMTRLRPAFLLGTLLLAFCAGPAAADRAIEPQLAPRSAEASLAAVARLRPADRTSGGCSAVLIGPDLALTAAHCARGAVAGPRAMQLLFRPGESAPAFRATVRAVAFHADYAPAPITARNAHADLALLRLARPVPPEIATPIPVATGEDAELVAIYGYVNGAPDLLRGHPGCALRRLGPGLSGSDCRVVSGLSGAPVLSGGPGNWRVEGIAVARLDARHGGAPLRALIADVSPWPPFAGPYALAEPPS